MAAVRLEPITSIPTKADDAPSESLSGAPVDHSVAAAIGTGFRYALAPQPQAAGAPGGTPPINGQTVLGALVFALAIGGMWISSVVTDAKAIATEAQRAGDETDRRIREVEGKVLRIESKMESIDVKVGAVETSVSSIDDKQDRMGTDLRRIQESLEYLTSHRQQP